MKSDEMETKFLVPAKNLAACEATAVSYLDRNQFTIKYRMFSGWVHCQAHCLSGQRVCALLDFRWFFLCQVVHPETLRGQKEPTKVNYENVKFYDQSQKAGYGKRYNFKAENLVGHYLPTKRDFS